MKICFIPRNQALFLGRKEIGPQNDSYNILKLLVDFEPSHSYKKDSYMKKTVYILQLEQWKFSLVRNYRQSVIYQLSSFGIYMAWINPVTKESSTKEVRRKSTKI